MSKRIVSRETRGVSTCEFCGGSVTLKEWFIKDERGVVDGAPSGFLFVCEGCGRGAGYEVEILRMVQGFASGEISWSADEASLEDC